MMIFSPEIGVAITCEKVKLHKFSSTVLRKTNPVKFDQVKRSVFVFSSKRVNPKEIENVRQVLVETA